MENVIKLCREAGFCDSIICHVVNYLDKNEIKKVTSVERIGNEIFFYSEDDTLWDRYFDHKIKKFSEHILNKNTK